MGWLNRIAAIARNRKLERDLEEELQFHIELKTKENIAAGMPPEEARYAALRMFGNVSRVKEECRDSWGVRFINELVQDLRYGLRQLRRNPGFTAVAVLTLALGIGANTAIFTVVYAVLLEPLPYRNPGRLVYISEFWPQERTADMVPTPDFANWHKHSYIFRGLAAWGGGPVNLSGGEEPEVVRAVQVSGDFFSTLGVQPFMGRSFLPKEEQPGGHQVVILSYALWKQRFGSDRRIIGKSIKVDEKTYTIVGIMPATFRFPDDGREPQLFRPNVNATAANWHSGQYLRIQKVIGRLAPGVSLDAAGSQLTALALRTRDQEPPEFRRMRKGMEVRIAALHDELAGNVRPFLLILAGVVGLVLLIAIVNVACLELARGTARQKEMGVRAALGATRYRVARQLLTESVLLAIFGGVIGLFIGFWGVQLFRAIRPQQIPRYVTIGLDSQALVFTLVITVVTGILFGLVPAFFAFGPDLKEAIGEGGQSARASTHHRLRGALLVTELAVASILLAGAVLLTRTFIHLMSVDPGFNPQHLLTLQIVLPESKYAHHTQQEAFYQQLLERLRSLPGAKSGGIGSGLPIGGPRYLLGMGVQGQPLPPPGLRPDVPFDTVSPGYFQTLGIPLIAGREFANSDDEDTPPVAIVNQAFVRRFFPGGRPLNKNVYIGVWRKIIGIVGDVRQNGPLHSAAPEVYGPYLQSPNATMLVVIRTFKSPLTMVGEVRKTVMTIDKNQPISDSATMEQRLASSLAAQRVSMFLVGFFAALALVLAAVGIYGVISYSVRQRTHEIGIRMALGAEKRDVLRMVIGQGFRLALIGVAIGVAGALALTRFLSSLLYGVKPTDPLTFVVVSLILIAVSLLACYIPARRACKIDPMEALRYE